MNLTLEVERENRSSVKIHMDVEPNTCPADKTFVACLQHYNGFYEPSTARFFVKAIQEGDFIVDIGANIGYFSLLAAALTGPSGRVIACEPLPANVAKLQANILCNSIFNIKLVTAPVWSCEKEVTLYAHDDGRLASLGKLDSPSDELRLQATTLHKICRTPPRILKIDAEGAELDILEGGDWLIDPAQIPYVICEINEETAARTKMGDARVFMEGRGYSMFLLNDEAGMPLLVPPKTAIIPNGAFFNALFSTPDAVSEIWSAIKMAPTVMVV